MNFNKVSDLFKHLEGVIALTDQGVTVLDEAAVPEKMDDLVYAAVFADGLIRDVAS